jgi:hypothetical protein
VQHLSSLRAMATRFCRSGVDAKLLTNLVLGLGKASLAEHRFLGRSCRLLHPSLACTRTPTWRGVSHRRPARRSRPASNGTPSHGPSSNRRRTLHRCACIFEQLESSRGNGHGASAWASPSLHRGQGAMRNLVLIPDPFVQSKLRNATLQGCGVGRAPEPKHTAVLLWALSSGGVLNPLSARVMCQTDNPQPNHLSERWPLLQLVSSSHQHIATSHHPSHTPPCTVRKKDSQYLSPHKGLITPKGKMCAWR